MYERGEDGMEAKDLGRAFRAYFWSQVDFSDWDGCWLWQGPITDGYGLVYLPSEIRANRPRKEGAHRLAWELEIGEPPGDLFVLHACDARSCVSTEHLFLGTHQDNMADMARKKRKDGKKRKLLSDAQILEIRRRYGGPHLHGSRPTQGALAKEFGISRKHINDIVNCRIRKHLRL